MEKIKKRLFGLFFLIQVLVCPFVLKSQSPTKIAVGKYFEKDLKLVLSDIKKSYDIDVYAYNNDVQNIKVSINMDSSEISNFLNLVLTESGLVTTSFNEKVFFVHKPMFDDLSIDYLKQEIENAENISRASSNTINIESYGKESPLFNSLEGFVIDSEDKTPITGCLVSINDVYRAETDEMGRFVVKLENNINLINLEFIGYLSENAILKLYGDGVHKFIMQRDNELLEEIVISDTEGRFVSQETQAGVTRIDMKSLEKLPSLFGEKDVVKAVLLNPGVSSIGDGASGFNVRGGNVDQNLILMDDAPIFNSSHALGFFSIFNADIIKSATLNKGAYDASYGGRLASVLHINSKDIANKLKYKLSVNLLSATGTVESLLGKYGKIMLAARKTYSDYILSFFPLKSVQNSKAGFYDFNGKWSFTKNKDFFTLSTYTSKDNFLYDKEFGFDYGTKVVQGSWNRLINSTTSNKLSLVWSKYNSSQESYEESLSTIFLSNIEYLKISDKYSFVFQKLKIDVGASSILYTSLPGEFRPLDVNSLREPEIVQIEKGLENAIYLSSDISLTKKLTLLAGLRVNHFGVLGKRNIFIYKNDENISVSNIVDTASLSGMYKSYVNPEIRLSSKYDISKQVSLKAGYGTTTQYLGQIFNTDTPSPSSQWQLVNHVIEPSFAQNFSLGFFRNSMNKTFEMSLEGFYRKIQNVYDFKDYAQLYVNDHIETELLKGKGISQGIELSVRKTQGKATGFFSYTYSTTINQIQGINGGRPYFSNYHKPHNLGLVLNYNPIERITYTLHFTYSSGRPTTGPISSYITGDGVQIPIYSDRNELRIPDTHRLDLSVNFGKSHDKAAKFRRSWTFSIYNVYGRKNPFSVFYTRGFNDKYQANQLAFIGTVFPSLSLNLEFQ